MGKELPPLGVTKKKVSEDKVSKHESKHKKHKRHNVKRDESDEESSKDFNEQEGGASLTQHDDDKTASDEPLTKKEKKRLKKEKRLREEALKQLMAKASGPSATASGSDSVEAAERKGKENDKRPVQQPEPAGKAEEAGAGVTEASVPSSANEDIFMIDVNPAPENREKLRALSEDEDMEDGGALLPERQPGYTAAPSGKNRLLRRRMQLIEREKARIQKKLGVREGSDEHAQEVQQQLNEFIKTYDAKAEKREIRKNERKRKEAIRQRCRRGAAPQSRK